MIRSRKTVLDTPWFQVIAKTVEGQPESQPYYCLEMPDYVSVFAVTDRSEVILVRQYRPSVERATLELPSGHVDKGESPESAARRELLEETGYEAGALESLGSFLPDTGRWSNRMWCFFAPDVRLKSGARIEEEGLELVVVSKEEFVRTVKELRFDHALNMAVVFIALMKSASAQRIFHGIL